MSLNKIQKTFISPVKVPEENSFNFLRLVCCLIVIYEHCVVLSGLNFPCYDLRGIAVKVFFILSGFWVTQSFLKSDSIKNYAIKRFKKILPQYWLVVLVCAVGLSAFSVLPLREYFCNSVFYKYLAANILTLNFIQPNLPGVFEDLALNGSVNGSLWTIKIEIGFYILLPFIVFAVKRLREKFNGGGRMYCACRAVCTFRFVRGFYAVCNCKHLASFFIEQSASCVYLIFCRRNDFCFLR